MPFKPSIYQQGVFDWIESGHGDAVVNAVAGSGKTTTLLQAATRLTVKRALFVAFNKLIADELATKLQQSGSIMRASTIHSLGKASLEAHTGKCKVVGNKYLKICRAYLDSQGVQHEQVTRNLQKLVSFAQLTLVEPTEENLITIVDHYDLKDINIADDSWFVLYPAVSVVLEAGKQQAIEEHIIDFNDMVWLPNVLEGVKPAQYDFVFVDECQDLNAAQLELVLKCRAPGGRMLFVGDRRQSLYGFAGADTESVNKIVARTGATELPLSICYRCPTSHVLLAKQVVNEIEPSPYAESGVVGVLPAGLLSNVQPSSENTVAVLCRTTAPLVSACLKMLQSGKRAIVRGKDIGASIIDIVEKITSSKKRNPIGIYNLLDGLSDYRATQLAGLQRKEDNELLIESLYDRCDTVEALYVAYISDCKAGNVEPSIEGLKQFIDSKFDDTVSDDAFVFSTVHKSKGLEFHSVYILNPANKLMPHPAAKKDWQVSQEYNLIYVVLTRAKRSLYFLDAAISWLVLPDNATIESVPTVEQVIEKQEEQQKVKRGRGRPRKAGDNGAIRDRVNVSLDVDVIRFLRSQKNYSELLEGLVQAMPEFDQFLKSE